jgi:hypothetical protein
VGSTGTLTDPGQPDRNRAAGVPAARPLCGAAGYSSTLSTVVPEPADQRAEDQRAEDQRAEDQRAEDQRADDQRADDQRADV